MIALYKGISFTSRLIRWRTWSTYSHVAWVDPRDGWVWQAWRRGVTCDDNLDRHHTPGTRIDLFDVEQMTPARAEIIRAFFKLQRGKPYDFAGIMGFVLRRGQSLDTAQRRWFCSELVFAAHAVAGIDLLLRTAPWQVTPGQMSLSPLLTYVRTHVVQTRDPRDACGEVWAHA